MSPSGGFRAHRYLAQDGLSLYFRDYGDLTSRKLPLLCLPGLTRNSKDFHKLACRMAPRRVLCPDLRGRGRSSYDPDHRHYEPRTYISDILHLLALTHTHRAIVVGTSLGGILAMILGAVQPSSLAGVVLNDIGPEVLAASQQRIAGSIGNSSPFADWDHAAATLKAYFANTYPDLQDAAWQDMARMTYQLDAAQRPRIDYDPYIAKTLDSAAAEGAQRLWGFFGSLARIPTLSIRGALSDVLTAETFHAMQKAKPDLVRVELANRGHAPLLDEPECVTAIDGFLAEVDP